jgi:nucleoid-associated protein YgaU
MPDSNANMGDKPAANFSDVQAGSSSTAPASPADTPQSYTVQSGDSLSRIARHVYGDANKWHAIYDANRDKIKNPDLIQPGQVLTLPPNA